MNKRLLIALAVVVGIVVVGGVILFGVRIVSAQAIIAVFNQRAAIAKECVQPVLALNGRQKTKRGKPMKTFDTRLFDNRIHSIDVAACPEKFRLAWLDYVHAVDQAIEATRNSEILNDSILGMIGVATRSAKLANNLEKPGEARDALEQAEYSLERVAVEYGVVFVRKSPDNQ
jgi:hypothetical protein